MEVLLLHEKHGDRVVGHTEGVDAAALKVVTERLADGYWYDDWNSGVADEQWKSRAERIVAEKDEVAALRFLDEREDFEYEGYEVQAIL